VWYSWSEAREVGHPSHDEQRPEQDVLSNHPPKNPGFKKSLLDHGDRCYSDFNYQHPPDPQIHSLWDSFVTNVHPMTMLFFAWDKQTIIETAADDPISLSSGQRAFCFSIYFISTLSLSEEECNIRQDGHTRSSTLDDFQEQAEAALIAANYASTGDLIVLQAFILYLVSHIVTV
jgi:hypothetical protein